MQVETIKHAAVKSVEGWIIFGKCHADCFHKAHFIKVKMSGKSEDQGFITSFGRYVKRVEAGTIAFMTGQTDEYKEILYSEDLWSLTDSGKFDYDIIEGYVLKEEYEK